MSSHQINDGFIMWQRVTRTAPTYEIEIAERHSRDAFQCLRRRGINETLEGRTRRSVLPENCVETHATRLLPALRFG